MSYIESVKTVFGFLSGLFPKKPAPVVKPEEALPNPTKALEDLNKTYLASMKFIASPNFNLRPSHRSIKCIVLHHTGGTFQSAITWFQTPDSKVSAHYVVSRKGEIVQMVDEAKRAWHAGGSSWLGEEDINSISIGIEMEGDGVKPFTKEQIAATLELCKDIRKRRAITDEWVVLHKEIAPERKTDPSPFDKAAFISELNK